MVTNQGFRSLVLADHVDPFFIRYYVLFSRRYLEDNASGTTFKELSGSALGDLVFPVPPIDVQRQIVARIDELFAEIDDGEAALARARDDLATWRKALLKAAVTGELTADWRAATPAAETGAGLLARIFADRRANWEAQPKNRGKRCPEQPVPETERLPSLPADWSWATLEQIALSEPNAIADGPFGSNLKSSHYVTNGPRVLRLQNIGRDGTFVDAKAHISREHFDSLGRHHVEAGDLVIAILGEPVPRAVIVPASVGPALVKADCIKVRLDNRLSAEFVWSWLNNIAVHSRFEHEVKGVGRPRLSMSHVRGLAVPVPPADEQRVIVQRLEQGLQSISDAVQAIDTVAATAATLRQSILAAAFRGELA